MRAIVLVGGEGTRLRPLTYTMPKPLLPIGNVAFLERQLAWLGQHGIDDVVLSLGYLPDAFVQHFPGDRFEGIRLHYAVEAEPLGTAGGVRYAADQAGIDERVVVCNGDVLTALDLTAFVQFHHDRGAAATISLARVADPSAFGVVTTAEDGEVKEFVEKPPQGRAPTDWINAGTYVLEPAVVESIPVGENVSIERETFPALLDAARQLFAYQSDAYWLDIGTPEKYLEVHADVLAGKLASASLPGDAVERSPGVWCQGEVAIAPDAVVQPPVLVGDGTTIGPGARVSHSVLGPGCAIGDGARVLRSVLFERAQLDAEAEAVDSVIGPAAVLEHNVIASDHTVVGAAATVEAGARVAGARIHVPGEHAAR